MNFLSTAAANGLHFSEMISK